MSTAFVALAAAMTLAAPGAAAPGAGARVVFRPADSRIDEASGIAVGVRSPGVVYVQNDSGDVARFFAVDARTGATAAVVTVRGARNVDWEDIATAPDAAGTPSVWLADTGDNGADRRTVQVYRVAEPHIGAHSRDRSVTSSPAQVWRLRYPDGPVDAESLAVGPDGVGYLITKSPLGQSDVYRVPASSAGGRVQTLQRVGSVAFAVTGTRNPFGVVGTVAATSAALARDGRLLVVRTYSDAYVWTVGAGGVPAAIRARPERVPLPYEPQGEGVAVDGDRLLVDSEGVHAPVWSVPLPPRSAPAASRSPATSAAPATTAAPTDAATPAAQQSGGSSPPVGLLAAAAAAVAALAAFGGFLVRRAGSRR